MLNGGAFVVNIGRLIAELTVRLIIGCRLLKYRFDCIRILVIRERNLFSRSSHLTDDSEQSR